jgi:hypothetical protein
MADYGVISDIPTSPAMPLDRDLPKPPIPARFQLAALRVMSGLWTKCALRSLVTEGSDHADEALTSLAHVARDAPVTPRQTMRTAS